MQKTSKKFICLFDSGFGGLNLLRSIIKELPNYNYIYLADTARAPYGNRSKEVIFNFTKQAVQFLFKKNCELIVLACNTASSEALRKIQQDYLPKYHPDKRVLGVIIPTAEEAVKKTKNKKVGVIATERTVESGTFIRELAKLDSRIKIFQKACPLLVPLVEAGQHNSKASEIILKEYLTPLVQKGIDVLILGCTHYGILEKKIKQIVGKNITVLSEARIIPKKLKDYLARHREIERKLGKERILEVYSTDITSKFERLGSKFFGKKIKVKKVNLGW